jgi:uncharacterized protein YecE (DUF72 family)
VDLPQVRVNPFSAAEKSKMSNGKIVIGTSGYSFADWVGPFYPVGWPKGKMLDYYKDHFHAVEINSTYYRIPHAAVFYHIANKVPQDFEFMVKTHQSFTHTRKELMGNFRAFHEALKPLNDSGKLKGYLAQFPWSFKFSVPNLQYLLDSRQFFYDIQLYVEFRHKSLNRPEVYSSLRDNNIGFCCVDEPVLSGLLPPKSEATTSIGYVRFHGRNNLDWWQPRPNSDRYNYSYKREELADWINKIDKLREKTEKVYLFFNNCHLGQAVHNAKMMMEMMQLEF